MSSEAAFRDWVRGRWAGWVDGREPRSAGSRSGWGSGNGAPDLTLGIEFGVTVSHPVILQIPVGFELKVCKLVKDQLVSQSEVLKSQREYHANARAKGVLTGFLWGLPYVNNRITSALDIPVGLRLPQFRPFVMRANNGFCSFSDAEELPQDEFFFRVKLEDWCRRLWVQGRVR